MGLTMNFLNYFTELESIDRHLKLAYKELQMTSQAIRHIGDLDISNIEENTYMALCDREMLIRDVIDQLEKEKADIWGHIDAQMKKKGTEVPLS